MMALCLVSPHKAFAIDFPGDSPTIEALINLHKLIKSEEDDAMARIATSFGEQSLVTKGAKAFNDARTTLDSKLNNAYSYVLFAAALSGTANSLYKLINEYSKFTQSTASTAFSKPSGMVLCGSEPCLRQGVEEHQADVSHIVSYRPECNEGIDGREDDAYLHPEELYRQYAPYH